MASGSKAFQNISRFGLLLFCWLLCFSYREKEHQLLTTLSFSPNGKQLTLPAMLIIDCMHDGVSQYHVLMSFSGLIHFNEFIGYKAIWRENFHNLKWFFFFLSIHFISLWYFGKKLNKLSNLIRPCPAL